MSTDQFMVTRGAGDDRLCVTCPNRIAAETIAEKLMRQVIDGDPALFEDFYFTEEDGGDYREWAEIEGDFNAIAEKRGLHEVRIHGHMRTVVFHREDMFYPVTTYGSPEDLEEHARRNPGTLMITDPDGTVLWPKRSLSSADYGTA